MTVFLFIMREVTFFSYMYYTSATWSLVGCLVAGFGVYPLLQPCITASRGAQKPCVLESSST